MMVLLFSLFAVGLILGLIPPFCWGKIGGDEPLIAKYPNLASFLKFVHHWQIGVIIVCYSLVLSLLYCFLRIQIIPLEFNVIICGSGTSMALDDIMFHSLESYFVRKIYEENKEE